MTLTDTINLSCIVVSFRQTPDDPEHIYFVSDRPINAGDYYLDPTKSNFLKVAWMGTQKINDRCRKIEATTNERCLERSPGIQRIQKSFVDAYFASGKEIKQAPLRVKQP